MELNDFLNLAADGHHRIQRRHRVLKNQTDAPTANFAQLKFRPVQ